MEELDQAGIVRPVGVGTVAVVASIAESGAIPLDVLVESNLVNVGILLEGRITSNVNGDGNVGGRISSKRKLGHLLHRVDNIASAVVHGSGISARGRKSRASVESIDSTSALVALAPAAVHQEDHIALLDTAVVAITRVGVVVARGIKRGVELVVPLVEIASDASRGGSTSRVVGNLLRGLVAPTELLDDASRSVNIALDGLVTSIGSIVEIGHTELLARSSRLIKEDQVVLAIGELVISSRRLGRNDLNGMGEGTNHIVRGGTSTIGLNDKALVPVGHVDVVLGIPIGIAQTALEGLGLGGGEVTVGSGQISERSRADVDVPGIIGIAGIGQNLDGKALAAGGEVVLGLAIDGGGNAHGNLAVAKEMAGAGVDDGGTLAIQVLEDLNLLEKTRIAEELELVLDATVGIHNSLGTLNVGDNAVGQSLEGGNHIVAMVNAINHTGAIERERIGDVVLAVGIIENESILSRQNTGIGRLETDGSVSDASGGIVGIQRINVVEAQTLVAVRSAVARVALAGHGNVVIPQSVTVATVLLGHVGNALAGTVARAHANHGSMVGTAGEGTLVSLGGKALEVALELGLGGGVGIVDGATGTGTGGTVAGGSVVSGKALAHAGEAVAKALVGALGILVGGVDEGVAGSIAHVRKGLSDSVRIHGRSLNDEGIEGIEGIDGIGAIHIAKGRADVRLAEGTLAKAAVASGPSRVACFVEMERRKGMVSTEVERLAG